ncbi:MAG: phage tail sheath subtilisin-like domain-containing protein [Shimia sp.]
MPSYFLHGVEVREQTGGLRPISVPRSTVIGLVGTAGNASDAFPVDTPVLVSGPTAAAALGTDGTLLDAYEAIHAQGASEVVVVRVAEGGDMAATRGAVAGTAAGRTGLHALLDAEALTGQSPRILVAPGFSRDAPGDPLGPVATALVQVADKARAIAIVDGPDTDETDALARRGDLSSDRAYFVDPGVQAWDATAGAFVTRPASGYVAGLIARRDIERGFWWSPSNQVLAGVAGTSRPIGFSLSDPQTEANRLNEGKVATIIRHDGFRLWGNRGTGSDPQWAFVSVRRTADLIYAAIEQAHLWAMDRPMSAQLLLDLRDSVQAFGDDLVARGALLGFEVRIDPEANSQAAMLAGQLTIDFDFEPPAPLEHLVFRAHRNGTYYEELIRDVRAAA